MSDMITALMVTHPKKKDVVQQSIESFLNQTYVNKYLLILNTSVDKGYTDYLIELAIGYDQIIIMENVKPKSTLGENRNRLLDVARGDIVMTWDDDDLSHPNRMQVQYDYMKIQNKRFCFLTAYCHLFETTKELFILDRLHNTSAIYSGNVDLDEILENTMMGYLEDIRNFRYDSVDSGEDSPLNKSILKTKNVAFLTGRPNLFTYRFCGSNVWKMSHHKEIVRKAKDMSFKLLNSPNYLNYYPNFGELKIKDNKFQVKEIFYS